jgi:hypothetical protein
MCLLIGLNITANGLALGAVADFTACRQIGDHKTVNTPQKLMRGRMFN